MTELTAFLLSRIVEDEYRLVVTPGWCCPRSTGHDRAADDCLLCAWHLPGAVEGAAPSALCEQLDLSDERARTQAELEAARRAVDLLQKFGHETGCPLHRIVLHLAAGYADHPDYRDEWRLVGSDAGDRPRARAWPGVA